MKIFKIRIGLSSINTFSEGPQILLLKKQTTQGLFSFCLYVLRFSISQSLRHI